MLLDAFFEGLSGASDIRNAAADFQGQLLQPGNPRRENFVSSIGVIEGSTPDRVLRWICDQKSVPLEYWTKELVADGTLSSDNECQAVLEYLLRLACVEIRKDSEAADSYVQPDSIIVRLFSNQSAVVKASPQGAR